MLKINKRNLYRYNSFFIQSHTIRIRLKRKENKIVIAASHSTAEHPSTQQQ